MIPTPKPNQRLLSAALALALAMGTMAAPGLRAQEEGSEEAARFELGVHFAAEVWGAELQGLDLFAARMAPVQSAQDADANGRVTLDEAVRGRGGGLGADDLDTEALLRVEGGITWARADDPDPHRNRAVIRALIYDPSEESFGASSSLPVNLTDGEVLQVGGILPILGTATQVNLQGENLPMSVAGSVDVEATQIDLLWTRRVDLRDGWELAWSAGMRYMEFETRTDAVFRTDTPRVSEPPEEDASGNLLDVTTLERVSARSEVSGIGPLVGVRVGYRFGQEQRFGVHAGLEVSGLRAEADWAYRSEQQVFNGRFRDEDDIQTLTELTDEGSDRTITTLDVELGLSYRFNPNVELAGGLRNAFWEDVRTDVTVLDTESPAQESLRSEQESVDVPGVFFGIKLDF